MRNMIGAVVPRQVAQTNTGMAAYVTCIVVCKCCFSFYVFRIAVTHTSFAVRAAHAVTLGRTIDVLSYTRVCVWLIDAPLGAHAI